MSLSLSKELRLRHENLLSADDIMPREIWLEIAKVAPSAWTCLSLVVPAVGTAARDPAKQSALMTHFTDSDGRLPNGARHGKHRCNDGTYYYWKGNIHRDNDQPAAIHRDGSRYWYQHGEFHRDNDQPAVIERDGTQMWYQDGERHRDNDQPAVIEKWVFEKKGTEKWYQYGQLHRDNDKPAIIYWNGTQEWFQNGVLHRDNDQPALIDSDGTLVWFQNGEEVPPPIADE